MFISTGRGFQIVLPNGWKISVQFGITHYCEKRVLGLFAPHHELEEIKKTGQWTSENAEVAVLDPHGGFINTWYSGDDVMGWVTVEQLLPIINEVAQYKAEQTVEQIDPQFGRSRAEALREREID